MSEQQDNEVFQIPARRCKRCGAPHKRTGHQGRLRELLPAENTAGGTRKEEAKNQCSLFEMEDTEP